MQTCALVSISMSLFVHLEHLVVLVSSISSGSYTLSVFSSEEFLDSSGEVFVGISCKGLSVLRFLTFCICLAFSLFLYFSVGSFKNAICARCLKSFYCNLPLVEQ